MNIQQFTLSNQNGMEVRILNYGGIIASIMAPDKQGRLEDIVLGFDKPEAYQKKNPYFGAIVGRYGNRIAQGKFTLNGKDYKLAVNNGPNHLHGGKKGFDKVLWEPAFQVSENRLTLSYTSHDGEEGYPGNLDVTVHYILTEDNELYIEYMAVTDLPTPVNLTNHSYFNLGGKEADTILDHQIKIHSNYYVPVNENLIPTGEIKPVQDSPFDFRQLKSIKEHIEEVSGGYDHTFVLTKAQPKSLTLAARVYEPHSGRTLKVLTTQPGMQFYTGNFLDGSVTGKGGKVYHKHTGFCLETQHYPDSPNHPKFPNTILNPGEIYRHTTVYQFGVDNAS